MVANHPERNRPGHRQRYREIRHHRPKNQPPPLTAPARGHCFCIPVEAMHGDLGIVGPEDVFLAMSYSGETDELNILMPSIRDIGCSVISMTGNPASTLAEAQ
jgi:hypothetical protein